MQHIGDDKHYIKCRSLYLWRQLLTTYSYTRIYFVICAWHDILKIVLFILFTEYGTATERRCLQRGPSDNEERCAYTLVQRKKVYMCFCKGDLCNNSNYLTINIKLMILPVIYTVYRVVL